MTAETLPLGAASLMPSDYPAQIKISLRNVIYNNSLIPLSNLSRP